MRNGGYCWNGKPVKDDSPLSPVLLSQAAFDDLTDEVVALRAENARLTAALQARRDRDAAATGAP